MNKAWRASEFIFIFVYCVAVLKWAACVAFVGTSLNKFNLNVSFSDVPNVRYLRYAVRNT